jgi:hypothetical protein
MNLKKNHCGGPFPIPARSMWNLRWTKRHGVSFLSERFSFPCQYHFTNTPDWVYNVSNWQRILIKCFKKQGSRGVAGWRAERLSASIFPVTHTRDDGFIWVYVSAYQRRCVRQGCDGRRYFCCQFCDKLKTMLHGVCIVWGHVQSGVTQTLVQPRAIRC